LRLFSPPLLTFLNFLSLYVSYDSCIYLVMTTNQHTFSNALGLEVGNATRVTCGFISNSRGIFFNSSSYPLQTTCQENATILCPKLHRGLCQAHECSSNTKLK
jgi:hypothetical protein